MNRTAIITIIVLVICSAAGAAFLVSNQAEKLNTLQEGVVNGSNQDEHSIDDEAKKNFEDVNSTDVIKTQGANDSLETFDQKAAKDQPAPEEGVGVEGSTVLDPEGTNGGLPECMAYEQAKVGKGKPCMECKDGRCSERLINF